MACGVEWGLKRFLLSGVCVGGERVSLIDRLESFSTNGS